MTGAGFTHRRGARAAAALFCALVLAGCNPSSLTIVEPSPAKCNIVLAPSSTSVAPAAPR